MKSILTSIGAFFIVAFAMGQSANFPMLTDAYGDQKVNEMLAEQSKEAVEELEYFASKGWSIVERKQGQSADMIDLGELDASNFNPLKFSIQALEGEFQYFQIQGTDKLLIIMSKQEVAKRFQRYGINLKAKK